MPRQPCDTQELPICACRIAATRRTFGSSLRFGSDGPCSLVNRTTCAPVSRMRMRSNMIFRGDDYADVRRRMRMADASKLGQLSGIS